MTTASEWGEGYVARVLLDSVNPVGCRLVTWVLRYPRMIHSEFLTHRMFSKNSSSSRAIPIQKMIEQVEKEPVLPVYWGKNQSGMAAREELDEDSKIVAKSQWLGARDNAVDQAWKMHRTGVHKQIVNRVLEPWMWITVVMSSTSHANFFALRDHPDAQPEIAQLARMMRAALGASVPTLVPAGAWHLPFLNAEDAALPDEDKRKVSVARCARVSYLTHDGVRSIEKDLELHDRLETGKPPHVSPFEHVAMATDDIGYYANFRGWSQYRRWVKDECAPEPLYRGGKR